MAIIKEQSKTFPLWFQTEAINANYASEYYTCLNNMPVETMTESVATTQTGFTGTSLYSGGILAPNGFTYCIPFSATAVLKLDTENDTSSTFGVSLGGQQWLGGVLGLNGKIYCACFLGDSILVIDTNNDTTYEIGAFTAGGTTDVWNSGAMGGNGKIYFAPYRDHGVLVLDTVTETTTLIAAAELNTSANYNGAAMGIDGNVYLTPRDYGQVMKIDVSNDTKSYLATSYAGTNKWDSGSMSKDGIIYCAPKSSTVCLKIDTNTDTTTTFGSFPLPYWRTALDVEGNIWVCPENQTVANYGKINTSTDAFTNLANGTAAFAIAHLVMDKRGVLNSVPYTNGRVDSIGVPLEINDNLPLSRYSTKS